MKTDAIKPEEGFSGVAGAKVLPDGTILVDDAGRRSIHRLNNLGYCAGRNGRQGKGPGEFEEWTWVGAFAHSCKHVTKPARTDRKSECGIVEAYACAIAVRVRSHRS